jgi:hypothetical protein
MIAVSDFIHIPYTRDLSEGGIAYAVRSLPYTYNRISSSPYDRLRRIVSGVAVELAFRRYLGEHEIPFDVLGPMPFTEPDRYDVSLGGRRCDIKSFLISHRDQIAEMRRNLQVVLNAPALVASDLNAAESNRSSDIYLFAFLSGLVAASQDDLHKVAETGQPHYLIHVMPEAWARPSRWSPLGTLVLKSESERRQIIEIGGQDAGREMRSLQLELPAKTRIQIDEGFFSVTYIHSKTLPNARLGIHSSMRKETHMIGALDWGNIWVYGMNIWLTGYLTHEEFNQRASFLREGARVFQYEHTRTKNLAVNVFDLKPLAELFAHVKEWNLLQGE